MVFSIAGLSVVFVGLAASTVWRAFVIMTLWNWFMPMLFGLPYLNVWQAMGLGLVVLAVSRTQQPNLAMEKENTTETLSKVSMSGVLFVFFYGLILLGTGYVAHCVLLAQ